MTQDQAYNHLLDNIITNGYQHRYYDQTVSIAEEAKKLASRSTEDQKKEITGYRIREGQELKEQRIRLTNTITAVALSPVYSYLSEIARVDGIKMEVTETKEETRKKVASLHAKYKGEKSLRMYLHDYFAYCQKYDPNAWVVYERKLSDDGNNVVELYPIEVSSKEALDYRKNEMGLLEYLAFMHERQIIDDNGNNVSLSDYFLYGIGYVWHFAEVKPGAEGHINYEGLGYSEIEAKGKTFMARLWTNGTTEVPATRAGAYPDGQHENEICETLAADAYPILKDIQRDKSLLDVSKVIHAIPRLFEYVKPCKHVDEPSGLCCDHGYYGGVKKYESQCRQCKGAGYLVHGSEQDVIRLIWPHNQEDLWPLDKIAHYESMPFEIVRFLREEMGINLVMVFMAVYNQEAVDKSLTVQTATEITINKDKVYNKLHPFGNQVAIGWERAIRVGHQYHGDVNAKADMSYPLDYKLKSVSELIKEYKEAEGMPYEVRWSILLDILGKQYRNMPKKVAEIKAFEKFRPWKEKSPEEVLVIIQDRSRDDPDRILWENWSRIVSEIQQDRGDALFSALDEAKEQRRVVYKKAQKVGEEIGYASSGSAFDEPFGLGAPPDDPQNPSNANAQ